MLNSASPTAGEIDSETLLLELASLHPFALATDEFGRISWMTRALEEATSASRGAPCAEVIPELGDLPKDTKLCRLDPATLRLSTGPPRPISATWLRTSHAAAPPSHYGLAIVQLTEEGPHRDGTAQPGADLLTAVLHNTPDAVIALDRWGFITFANSAVEQLTRFNRDELLHRPAFLLASRNPELQRLVSHLGSGTEIHSDLKCEGGDGRPRSLHFSCQPLVLHNGEPDGQVVFLRDVTERQSILDQLAEKNAELESYVNTVSHDLRSPLASLLGFSHLLRQDYDSVLDDVGRHFLDRIDQAAQTMESLTDDLLSLSKIGQVPIQRTLLDLGPVLSQLRAELKPRLEARGVELILPEATHHVYSDPTRLYQIFSNLIGNAILHMGDRADATIRVEAFQNDEFDLLCVQDNGIGIAASDQERIFHPFQRLESPDREATTGMGLAIVQKIAAVHGGRAWVDSEPGHGSTFFVSLGRR